MSTRCTTHFIDGNRLVAIVYRHCDGYPDGHGRDLLEFLKGEGCTNRRLTDDMGLLAAQLIVWLRERQKINYEWTKDEQWSDFLSIRVMMEDPWDIEYRYIVRNGGYVTCQVVSNWKGEDIVHETFELTPANIDKYEGKLREE